MEYSFFDFLRLIGSLGLFLYGMKTMSEGLQKIAGDRMRSILSAMTSNRFMGVLTGLLITALIQSSSATTVMVVSFVNAGLLLFSFTIFAQEQKIVVKTRGKIDTEGNIIPGQYIKGAYVKIKNDHKYVTNKQGEFSFVPNKGSYIISKVSYSDRNSNKYMISNFDEWGKELNYSENTKYIVISTPKEQIRDILEARYYFTCVLDNILQADINEVDSLASERQLSGVNTDIKHFLINNYRDVAKKLIEELSLHFASIDYDQLNNFDKEFFYYLCTYQFQKADSMFCSIDIPNENRYTLNPLPRKAMLRLADYYDKAYILHASQFSLEMAAHYLGLKADLDVTNT